MSYHYTHIDGQRVEVHVAAAYRKLARAFKAATGYELGVTAGTRTRAEQTRLYNAWVAYRHGGPHASLAAPPGYSHHEADGPVGPRALDVHDSGSTPGVTVYGTSRANWMRKNAHRYGFDPKGYTFHPVEPWHIEYTGKVGGKLPKPKTPKKKHQIEEDDDMRVGFIKDTKGRIYAVDALTGKKRHIKTESEWLAYKKNGARYHPVAKQSRADAIPDA